MQYINKLLSYAGIKLVRAKLIPKDFRRSYRQHLAELRGYSKGFKVFRNFEYDAGTHPMSYVDFECGFAASILSRKKPIKVMDIGSTRRFVLGLLASFDIITLDIREREPLVENETVLCSDAKQMDLPSNSLDAIVTLSCVEHYGLGRYGDEFDLDADKKAFKEMRRVLKPNGILIFTTTITRSDPSIAFNAHRIYDYKMISDLCEGFELGEEAFFSTKTGEACTLDQITTLPTAWDVYCGYWIKVDQ